MMTMNRPHNVHISMPYSTRDFLTQFCALLKEINRGMKFCEEVPDYFIVTVCTWTHHDS